MTKNVMSQLFSIAAFVFASCVLCSCASEADKTIALEDGNKETTIPDKIDFTFHVKPILSDRCFICHGPDKNAVEGDLSLHSAEEAYRALGELKDHAAIVPGNAAKSSLVERIFNDDPNLIMPPPESNLVLEDFEKAILEKWIAQGAEYKTHWAFVPPTPQAVPENDGAKVWGSNEIDAFILNKLTEKGLSPSSQARSEKLLRRITFDLTGLPPTLEQIEKFATNPSQEKYEEVIDSLLLSVDYAENMAAEWMDIARYADTHGYQDDFERTMWPWRDWVIHAFKENMSYDQFVTYQLAGDLMPNANLEQILATGFNRNHKITAEGGVIPEEYRVEYVEDRNTTLGTAFLGLTLECARCHDHKYDPISQKDHFQFYSFFNTIPEKGLLDNAADLPEPYIKVTQKEVNDILGFINLEKSEMKEVPVMVMKEMDQPRSSFILKRGIYDQYGDEVFPDTPESILPFDNYPKNRLGLAKWLFDDEHPLTARVAVNRLWQRMFGSGIVASSFDFGNQGSLPTHPELLDFLAIKYKTEGWDIRKMLKYIAMSETYQQDTKASPEKLEQDPENKYLARASRLRLSSEAIRDQALAFSGLLNREVGGPSVKPYQPEGIWEETTGGGGGSTASYTLSEGEDVYRKSIYTFWKRTVPPPSMMTFDSSSRDYCSVKRQETNTPLQALVLLNDPQIVEAARVAAVGEMEANPNAESEQIKTLFYKATSRMPNETEIQSLTDYYTEMLSKVENGEISTSEYLSIGRSEVPRGLNKEKLVAMTLTAHTILNLDETINRG
ncbi:PSD1 and planctomycete cytochrome C domain-containing protein [Maribacter dokdonensis]|uniref:PSD1 and planctomycete cytochrome C domain-containing protein n=1 Tax=Maribacter dokdonensis TaxID=320912 RepID=UPI002736AB89|nr:PSD1 and planctomycete cytochrome C domain-containing protein [Maribacter dokdonensis]MDP2525758.1 PSD1 and planctomycete cytochrome C domain-containing protein [Maribacter dokdonensis]